MTRRTLALGCLLALAPAPGLAQAPAPPLTLERAVARFLSRNLAVEAARYRVDAARAERLAVALRPNPTLTVSGENLKASGPPPAGELYEVTSSLNYPIELGDKRRLRTEAADASVLLAEAQLADVLRQRLTEVKRAFYDVLLARTARDHALEMRRTFDTLVDFNRVRLEEGAIAEGELLKVRLERSKHDTAVTQAELALRQAGIKLLDLLGEPDFSTAGTAEGALGVKAAVPDVEALRAAALGERPSLVAAQHSLLWRRGAWRWSDRGPPSTSHRLWIPESGREQRGPARDLDPLPIHDRNQSAIARAIADEKTAQAEFAIHRTRVLAEVESAWHAWQTARNQAAAFERELLRQADESHAIALQAYQEGVLGLVEYFEAQRTLATLRHEYARTLFDAHAALVSLEQAVGKDLGR